MISIKDVLEGALGGVKLGTVAKLVKISAAWEQIVGKDLAGVCSPAYIWQKNLIVHVNDPAFLAPLDYSRMAILAKTQKILGGDTPVQGISIRYNEKKASGNYVKNALAPATEIPAETEAALEIVKDPEIKGALAHLVSVGLARGKKLLFFAFVAGTASACATISAPSQSGKNTPAEIQAKQAIAKKAKLGKKLTAEELARKSEIERDTTFYFMRAQMRVNENQITEAIADLKFILDFNPYFVDSYEDLARLSLLLGKYSDAVSFAQRGLALEPDNVQINSMLGVIYHNSKEYKRAEEYLKKAIASDPTREDVRLNLAYNYLELKEPENAEKEFLGVLKANPSSVTAMLFLAKTYVEMKDYYKAEEFLSKFILDFPDVPQGYATLGWVYSIQKKYDPAIEVYKKYLENYPPDHELQERLANVYLLKKSYGEALDVYKNLELNESNSGDLPFRMGVLYFQQGDYKQALEKLQLFRLNDGTNKVVPFYIARAYEELGLFQEAADEWEILFQSAPTDSDKTEITVRISGDYEKLKNYDKAEAALLRADGLKKDDPELAYMLGLLYVKKEQYPKAIEQLERSIKIAPQKAEVHFYLGVVYEKTQDYKKCVEAMKRSVELNPKFGDALNYIGYIYADGGENLAEAKKYVDRAMEIEPNNGYYEDSLAWIYYKEKNYPLALETILKAVADLKEKDPTVMDHLGDIYFAMKNWDKAIESYSASVKIKVDPAVYQKIEKTRNMADPTREGKVRAKIREKRNMGTASDGFLDAPDQK
ncbi:MAG: DUF721 domain-containing protein [Nitrospinae bacterium]|nr:DUF721 domain-containing protein [Nitrospinota bacterium]